MKLFGKTVRLTERAKRNLCLAPGVLGLAVFMLTESCATRGPSTPAPTAKTAAIGPISVSISR